MHYVRDCALDSAKKPSFFQIDLFFFSRRHLGSIEEIDPVEGQTRDKDSIESLYMANGKCLWRAL